MSKKETGGPAFPETKEQHAWNPGMTLRDYFAAKAMQALISSPHCPDEFDYKPVAKAAYGMANAMLEAREA